MSIDHVLKLYSETIRSPFLHYGFWDEPKSVDLDSVNLQEIKDAQGRYIEHLSSFIPSNVKSILDVGCGIGGNADYLHNKGYHIETLSPDDFQRTVIDEKFKGEMKFHHCKFEKFDPQQKYDLILESESACYIKIDQGFEKARETLRDGGYLLASDYFVHHRDGTKNPHLKSSHDMDKYLSSAAAYGFELIKEYDQTENTMPTLDYGKYFIERFINPSIEYGIYSAKKNYPKTARIVGKLVGPKFEAKMDQIDLLDSGLFRKYRKYMIYLFQKKNV
ncbi:MAG: methyltransferase domain-containing protein [Candidatus Marinimicrobia bacterium]|nr:methyltransferase domain-containing protein [Candidatus Neomarinimicrobiota bacterium]MBT3847794.1 methyltransferase domain-containing protein [Candidatus Neomarinimicrobiota bacterium]MBT4554781.1 methyltransferase domain-containing protein [Candidatus Neomarinimicrobiota bacterium]MBT5115337.1 methyltransferase domain-containing protein [Candidatus Neomarinimicrobiota bacterium]MBT6413886.1 methyltransferase domain-containing protein [Candidatus Neomarinimicrobiota bacterium]